MSYSKPWLSYEDQLARLKQRGLAVTDDAKALDYLARIGYYRLSGYWFPFRERTEVCCPLPSEVMGRKKKGQTNRLVLDEFKAGASFEKAVDLYVFANETNIKFELIMGDNFKVQLVDEVLALGSEVADTSLPNYLQKVLDKFNDCEAP